MKDLTPIDVGLQFTHRLANRDDRQGDGKHNAVLFRKKYLSALDNHDAWRTDEPWVILDFKNVRKLGPSFANEAFAYFLQYSKPSDILKKIVVINISSSKLLTIQKELEFGYTPSWKQKLGI